VNGAMELGANHHHHHHQQQQQQHQYQYSLEISRDGLLTVH